MEISAVAPCLKLIDLQTPIPGYKKFIGAYLFRGERTAIVDVGPRAAAPNLFRALRELNISPGEIDYIILTHIHIDHAGGVGTVSRQLNGARVVAHSRARPHLIDPAALWKASLKTLGDLALKYGETEPVSEDRILDATDGMKLDLGKGLVLEIYLTPGHASHHISIFERGKGVLIAGEAAGVCLDGIMRPATPPPFSLEDCLASIDRLIALEPHILCYGHFGCYSNARDKLNAMRQKILAWYEIVAESVKAGKQADDIFASVRDKDRSLDYLDKLGRDEYSREYTMILNDIRGLAEYIQEKS